MRYLLLLFAGISLSMVSCQPDDTSPDTPSESLRNKIIDHWSVDESSQVYSKSIQNKYIVQILKGNDSSKVLIDNFYNLGYNRQVTAIINEDYSVTIPSQNVDDFLISGSGTIDHGLKRIDFSYIADDQGGIVDTVTAVYTR